MRALLRSLVVTVILCLAAAAAQGADWAAQYKELRFGISSVENAEDTMARYKPFSAYMTRKLGVPVQAVRTTDYAGVIEGLRSEHMEFAYIGAGTYALGRKVMGDRLLAVACQENADGSRGYHSVIVVRANSPYQTVDDLKGKSLAYADPNSTSGYAAPVYYLTREGKPPDTFFGKTAFAGSHELEIIALLNGTFEAAADDWYSEADGNVQRMQKKGMIPPNSTRNVWTSPLIPNPPYVVRTELPAELRQAFVAALIALPTEDPAAWTAVVGTQARAVVPVAHEDYQAIIDMTLQNTKNRRRS